MPVQIEGKAPNSLKQQSFKPYGQVTPSPADWRDQVFYFLLPDRFSGSRETGEMHFDPKNPGRFKATDKRKWMEAGKKFQGGTLEGIKSKLTYLQDLDVTVLWLGPVWKQRKDLDTYHGYGIQNFLDIDPRFGDRAALRDLVDEAHHRGIYVILDIIYNHTGNNWFYDIDGQARETVKYLYEPPHDFHRRRSEPGSPTASIQSTEDGVWPEEFQNVEWYRRAGSIGRWNPER